MDALYTIGHSNHELNEFSLRRRIQSMRKY